MSSRDEDEVWRQIVANYGDAPSVEDVPREEPRETAQAESQRVEPAAEPEPRSFPWEDEGRFVPPPPPPIPRPEPRRALAWTGLFGAPLVLLTALVFGIYLPGWMSLALVAGFVGGFLYLVSTMPSEPRDPGDDGSRI
ncbi:MAG: hypothetical protein ABWX84_14030 [Nocardioides sp.]